MISYWKKQPHHCDEVSNLLQSGNNTTLSVSRTFFLWHFIFTTPRWYTAWSALMTQLQICLTKGQKPMLLKLILHGEGSYSKQRVMTKPQHLALEPLLVLPNKTEEQQNQTMAILWRLRLDSHTFHLLSEKKFLIYGGSVHQGDLVLIRESSKKHIGQMGGHLLKSSFMTTILFCITFSPPHHLNTRSLYKSSGFSKWSSNIRGPLFKW